MKFSFNKNLEITQMAEGLNRKIVNYCDNLMVCEVHFEREESKQLCTLIYMNNAHMYRIFFRGDWHDYRTKSRNYTKIN